MSGGARWMLGPDVLGTPGNVVRNVKGPLVSGGLAKCVAPTISGGDVFVAAWNADGSAEVQDFALPSCD